MASKYDQADADLAAARDGWGVSVRYILIRHGPTLARWVVSLIGATTALTAAARALGHG